MQTNRTGPEVSREPSTVAATKTQTLCVDFRGNFSHCIAYIFSSLCCWDSIYFDHNKKKGEKEKHEANWSWQACRHVRTGGRLRGSGRFESLHSCYANRSNHCKKINETPSRLTDSVLLNKNKIAWPGANKENKITATQKHLKPKQLNLK